MARLKFLVFALVVLGLWAAQLFLLSPAVSTHAVERASAEARMAPALLSARLDARRMDVQRIAVKVAGSPALLATYPAPTSGRRDRDRDEEAATTPDDRIREVRGAVSPSVPESFRRDLLILLVEGETALFTRGDEDPKPVPAGVDAQALAKAGGDGLVKDVFGVTQVFYSFPISAQDRSGEARTLATVVVGAPLVATGVVPDLAKESGLGAVALLKDGKVVSSAGPENALAETAEKMLAPGQTGVISQGGMTGLGPLKLPVLTHNDTTGGRAPLAVATRQEVPGTPFEVLGIVSTRPALHVLTVFQRLSVFGFGGLLGLTLVFALILGSGRAQAAEGAETPARRRGGDTLSLTPSEPPAYTPAAQPPPASSAEPPPASAFDNAPPPAYDAPPPVPSEPPPGEAYAFRDSAPPVPESASEQAAGEWSEFSNAAPPPASAEQDSAEAFFNGPPPPVPGSDMPFPPRQQPGQSLPSFDTLTTRAYPVPQGTLDAYDQGQGAAPAGFGGQPPGKGNESTLVAPIPDELLRAATLPSPDAAEPPVTHTGTFAAVTHTGTFAAVQPKDSEEQHYEEVFRDFVETRERCGEPADANLTYDKFVQKLRKNKEQLVQKYNCRSVRFTVYVKEGKAALKATPVKD